MIETMKGKKIYSEYELGYQQGRADAKADCEKCEADQWDAIYRAEQKAREDAIDEWCHWYFDMSNSSQINEVDNLIKRFNAEQLKE